MVELSESINVWVYFKGNSIQPFQFFWRGRQIKIEEINLMHTSRDGATTLYHFSVSSGGNFYRLRFDSKTLKWIIEAVEEE